MVHGLAGQLGGAFVLHSELGRGTQAQFYLPVSGAHVQTVDPIVPAATPNVRSLRILLVDDEELVRFGTAEMLRELGHSVWSVSDGAKAMLAFSADPQFDLVITDYMMPDINGAQLAKNIIDTFGEIPILIVTGYAGGDLNIGFPQLLKPFRQADLAKAIGLVCYKPR